jgi:pimeloyl-ACP methyl ester carboxylesterase
MNWSPSHFFRLITAGAAIGLSTCATPPAKLSRVEAAFRLNEDTSVTGEEKALHSLLTEALSGSAMSAHSLAQFLELWQLRRPGQDASLLGPKEGVSYRLRFAPGDRQRYAIGYFDQLSPATDFEVEKIKPHYRRDGVGAPLLGIRANLGKDPIDRFFPPEAISRAVTAVAEAGPSIDGSRDVVISLYNPLQLETVAINGQTQPLAADWSVPWAALLSRTAKLKAAALSGLINRKAPRPAALYLTEPYDPEKIPLIMIHGLLSTPLVWAELSNHLQGDDATRKRYQIWHFLYPTSPPALYSARIFRTKLDELRAFLDPEGDDFAMKNTVLIGHSMGGLISKTTIVRPGNAYWDASFSVPFEDLKLSPEDRESLREAFFWEPRSHIKRVIFIAVPHRGSEVANSGIGRVGRLFTDPPDEFEKFYRRISANNPNAFTPAYRDLGEGKIDSINGLTPDQISLHILDELPFAPGVGTHSIIGRESKSGPLEKSTDGVVPYISSHHSKVDSEVVMQAKHFPVIDHPEALTEIKRLLGLPLP